MLSPVFDEAAGLMPVLVEDSDKTSIHANSNQEETKEDSSNLIQSSQSNRQRLHPVINQRRKRDENL